MSNILDISIEPFVAGRIDGKCVAQCLVTFYYDEPRVITTVAVIEVPCSVVDDNVALLKYIESLEKTAIDSGPPWMIELLNGNALHIPLADKSVQCVITSPSYFGLRNYDG